MLYLENWTEEMIGAGRIPQAVYDFRADLGSEHNRALFENIVAQLRIPEKYHVGEINEELLFRIAVDEYRQGCFDSASEFLYYKSYAADKLGFPFEIEYSDRSDEYLTKEKDNHGRPVMSGNALEDYILAFLSGHPALQAE
jgi:hypothetical protein